MKKVLVIGYGRFGELLCQILSKDFKVSIYEKNKIKINKAKINKINIIDNLTALDSFSYIFICVPISVFKEIVLEIKDKTNKNQIVFDVCSVKSYPAKIMTTYLKKPQIIATHPLFGPDSFGKSLDLRIVLCKLRVSEDNYREILDYLGSKSLSIIETTPLKHDHDIIYSQAFTYIILNLIQNMNFPNITINTPSYLKMKEITDISINDSKQLFNDMLKFNPYFKEFYKKLKKGYKSSLKSLKIIAKSK